MTAVTSRTVTTALPTPTPTLETLRLLTPRQTRPTDVKSVYFSRVLVWL